jgi:hypothetical protein
MKHYLGFAVRIEEKETGILFKRKKQGEIFCRVRVGADSFAEAQDMIYDKMPLHKMTVVFVFPFTEEGLNDARRADFE